ncbi:flap endonuclease GEN-like 1 isoform X1 [Syzygium oleosum]|uniref:flap endonuclease GEN-like 1 isoform X1 n=1 Tax=Syzygium oleosum TaxID=219896 RepID=UPI0024BA2D09|nr:flap endonuclease GEN-like 1 isoform X1 [Syzygium oleosum]
MGVGGHFWDLLKPYARHEGFGYLRDKRVAVDLSFWIVQHETAIKKRSFARNPHLRLTFFRTINLFSKFGAFPVFVVDGTPSPLKSQARIRRFFQASGLDLSSLPVPEDGVLVERNQAFRKCVKECVELLELLGMPVLEAKGEAEALCAQLNYEGHVDACITADSDAFLFGANCVIKCIHPNSREPFECYHISDIEDGLGLKRNRLIAIALLVGNDHDLQGVQGIGVDKALRFVKTFSEEEILNSLKEIGNGEKLLCERDVGSSDDPLHGSNSISPKLRQSHCSFCGHPGSKRDHFQFSCSNCITGDGAGCLKKPDRFKCDCSSCDMDRKRKEQEKHESWQMKVCERIALEPNFPNNEIIKMYLSNNNGYFDGSGGPRTSWERPQSEMLVDFLAFHQRWEPSYIRQKLLPMMSTIYLRDMATNTADELLCNQYEFDCVHRVKTRYGYRFLVVKWKKATHASGGTVHEISDDPASSQQHEVIDVDERDDILEESEVPQIQVVDGTWFLLTDEDIELVRAAFPEEVDRFFKEKELKGSKRGNSVSSTPEGEESELTKSKGVQLSITEFYRSAKVPYQAKPADDIVDDSKSFRDGSSKKKSKGSSSNFSKSARRRLLFDS